jgi:hypothetical protein
MLSEVMMLGKRLDNRLGHTFAGLRALSLLPR